ncbi:Calycin-like protein [Chytridium lagenaria]|nr:Calycin-like protein [Chytridium lagenaria]
MRVFSILAAALSLFASATALPGQGGQRKCPPSNFDAVTDFALPQFLGQWYVQAQAPTIYLPVEQNYCVAANYSQTSPNTISIFNFSRVGSVTGRIQATTPNLKGTIRDAARPSKLSVGPEFLPAFLAGPYWVIATGPIVEDKYSWALISGGAPNQESNGRCLANEAVFSLFNGNGQGLWIFTREKVANPALVQQLRDLATSKGLDASAMNAVEQANCTYA